MTTIASMTTTLSDKTDVWHLTVANTTAQSYSATLNTAGKYLDRDITINYSTVPGSLKAEILKGTTVLTTGQSFRPTIANCSATVTGKTQVTVAPVTNTASISTDYFIALRTNTNTVTFTAKATVTESGYFAKDTQIQSGGIAMTTAASSVTYIPLASATIKTSADTGNLSKYFTEVEADDTHQVTITPKYINTVAGYSAAMDAADNKGGISYWSVKTSHPTVATSTRLETLRKDSSYSTYTGTSKIIVPSGGALELPAGWYSNTYITLADLIPDIATKDAADAHILADYKAFDEDGNLLNGSIQTRNLLTDNSTKDYYTSNNTGLGEIVGPGYIDSTTYIKSGALSTPVISVGAAFTPSIAVVTTDGTNGGINITNSSMQGTITPSDIEPTSGYYIAVNTAASNITVTASSKVETSGWINNSVTSAGATVNAIVNGANTTYLSIDAGSINVTGGSLATVTSTNNIDTSKIADGIVSSTYDGTKYAITATANVTMNNTAINIEKTSGYIENGVETGIKANTYNKNTTPTTTTYLRKASVTSSGSVTTSPEITVKKTPTGVTTASVNTGFGIKVEVSGTDGKVQTNYSASNAGYTPVTAATSGQVVTVTPSISGTNQTETIYIKAATISSKTEIANIDTYFNTVASGTGDITVVTKNNVTEGYTVANTTAVSTVQYNIKTTNVDTSYTTLTVDKKSDSTTFTSTNAVLYTSGTLDSDKEYVTITATGTIIATGKTSATATVTESGWVTTATINGTGEFTGDSGNMTTTNDIYIELYNGDYTYQ